MNIVQVDAIYFVLIFVVISLMPLNVVTPTRSKVSIVAELS